MPSEDLPLVPGEIFPRKATIREYLEAALLIQFGSDRRHDAILFEQRAHGLDVGAFALQIEQIPHGIIAIGQIDAHALVIDLVLVES